MPTAYLAEVLAQTHGTELRREATAARLAALARCCRPSAWSRATRRVVTAALRIRAALGGAPAACCATA